MKRNLFSVIGALTLCLSLGQSGFAASSMNYADVVADAWYADALVYLAHEGYLDRTKRNFEPSRPATRAEFLKLLMQSEGGILTDVKQKNTFTDVPASAWFHDYFEEAALDKWIQGDGNCVGTLPCFARPQDPLTRAEAAKLILQAKGQMETSNAVKIFPDNVPGTWYYDIVNTAEESCVLSGNMDTGRIRPTDILNRAEMAELIYRLSYLGSGGCESAMYYNAGYKDSMTVEVGFNVLPAEDWLVDVKNYLVRADFEDVEDVQVQSVKMTQYDTDSKSAVVELTLSGALQNCVQYELHIVADLRTAAGVIIPIGLHPELIEMPCEE